MSRPDETTKHTTAPKLVSQQPRTRSYRARGCPAKGECSHPMICESHGCAAKAAETKRDAEARSIYMQMSEFERNRVDAMVQAYTREGVRLGRSTMADHYCMAAALFQLRSMEANSA